MTGQSLSHFEILEKIGEGGMGVVYKARDTQLNRLVAIKLLHPDKVADTDRRRRFIQEARSASALNHPGIVTIYEIGEANGADFIAMEFVSGRTLDQLIPRKGMRLNEALKYSTQIAGALAKAHAAGITHRDLKPSNIIVTDDGRVKVLDFGLAKLIEPATGSSESKETLTAYIEDNWHTAEGMVVGTAAYMSPEQAEGKTVDARSDIFSFGSVLCEMVTGHRAFAGSTSMATLASVIHQEPKSVGELAPAAPRELEKLISRCLRKDVDRRAQHIADIKLGLEEIREDSESGSVSASHGVAAQSKAGNRIVWVMAACIGVLLAVGAGAFLMNRQPAGITEAKPPVVLTSYPGYEGSPALSPDGKNIAFTWNGEKEDNSDIYVKLVDAGTPVRLTQDPAYETNPAWSPDATFLAFVRFSKQENRGYYVIPALGGQERKIADLQTFSTHGSGPSVDWSPDGKSLVIADSSTDPPAIALVSVATGEKTRLTTPPPKSLGDSDPRVSPDGKWLAFSRTGNIGAGDWYVVPFAGKSRGEPRRLSETNSDIRCGAAWTAGSDALVACGERRLWRIQLLGGAPQPMVGLGEGDDFPTISRSGGRLAFHRGYFDTNLWTADLRNTSAEPIRVIASSRAEHQADYSPDGSRIVFCSTRTGRQEIWLASADGSNQVQLTTEGAVPSAPRWSPDGKRIVFTKRPGGNVDVYVMDAQGGLPRRLTTDPANDASAYWSRDGKWVYFASNRTGRHEVWKRLADGAGTEIQMTRNGGWRSRESPDGRTLYYQKFELPGLWRMPTAPGEEAHVAELPKGATWYLRGNASWWIAWGKEPELRRIDHATGRETLVRRLPPGTNGGTSNFAISPDERSILFVKTDQRVNDLMLIEGFQ